MTLIIVSGLPPRWDMKMLVRKLIQRIKGKFQVLTIKCTKSTRSGYVRLSEILDPQKVVNNINSTMFGKFKLHATIPDVPPILPSTVKPRELPLPLRRKYHIANEGSLGQVLHAAHTEILEELQSKFAGLFALSKAGGHKLLQAIAEELFSKLRCIMLKAADVKTSLKLTKQYRSMYPHHCDFSVIQSNYNNIERSAGRPLCSLNQDDLVTPTDRPYVLSNMPLDKAQVICTKYAKAISKKLQNHITGLKTNTDGEVMEEEAVNKVRLELKKIIPYIPMMVQIVVKDNIFQHKSMYHRVRIYGEPFIPNKEMMLKFLRKYLAVKVYRSDRAFNLMYCKVPSNTLPKFAEADGTNICGAIMCIRLSDVEYYKVPDTLLSKMLAFKGEMPEPPPLPADTHADKQDDYESEWSETW